MTVHLSSQIIDAKNTNGIKLHYAANVELAKSNNSILSKIEGSCFSL